MIGSEFKLEIPTSDTVLATPLKNLIDTAMNAFAVMVKLDS